MQKREKAVSEFGTYHMSIVGGQVQVQGISPGVKNVVGIFNLEDVRELVG